MSNYGYSSSPPKTFNILWPAIGANPGRTLVRTLIRDIAQQPILGLHYPTSTWRNERLFRGLTSNWLNEEYPVPISQRFAIIEEAEEELARPEHPDFDFRLFQIQLQHDDFFLPVLRFHNINPDWTYQSVLAEVVVLAEETDMDPEFRKIRH